MANAGRSDLPGAAHTRMAAALDDFMAVAAEYSALLNTQRAMLADGNIDGAAEIGERNTVLARRAEACAARLSPWLEAMDAHRYAGPRCSDASRRVARAMTLARVVAAAAAQLEELCMAEQSEAALALRRAGAGSDAVAQSRSYIVGSPGSLLLNKLG